VTLNRSADLAGPFSFQTVLWLLTFNALLLLILIGAGLIGETSARHSVVWHRWFGLTQSWVVPFSVAGWAWLTTAIGVLHFARDRHAETAGWLLLAMAFLAALPMILDLDFASVARLCLIAMTVISYGVGIIAVDRGGSPEEIHRDRAHRTESVDRPAELGHMPAHGR
jgi:hypothetical protein